MFWINNAYARVWKIDSKEKYDDLRISTAEKDSREEGKYINSNWFARAIGKAHNQIANGEISEESRIVIAKGKISNETYTDKDGNKKSALKVLILEFGDNSSAENTSTQNNKKADSKSKSKTDDFDDNEELPF